MTLQELLTETVETPSLECWDDESTASALRALAVRLHSAGISYRETAAALESIGIKRSHQAVYQWTHRVGEKALDPPTAKPSRVAVDETAIRISREQFWVYAALDVDSKLLLGIRVSRWRGTRPASAFLSELKERHDLSEAEFLVDGMGYLTALAQFNREVVPDAENARRPLPQYVDGRQSQRCALARRIRLLLQLSAAESSAR